MTKAEFSTEEVRVRKSQNLRFECCESLLLPKEYTFKNVSKAFTLKSPISCNSFIVIYVLNCWGCLEEDIEEMGVGKRKIKRQGQSIQTAHETTRTSKIKKRETYTNLRRRLFRNIPVSSDAIKWYKRSHLKQRLKGNTKLKLINHNINHKLLWV